MRGGSGAILGSFPTPLASTARLSVPPLSAGPRGIPPIGTFPVAAKPAPRANATESPCRANEAPGQAMTTNDANVTLGAVFDMRKFRCGAQNAENVKLR